MVDDFFSTDKKKSDAAQKKAGKVVNMIQSRSDEFEFNKKVSGREKPMSHYY